MEHNEFSTLCNRYKERSRGFFGGGNGCLLAAVAGLGLAALVISLTNLRVGWWAYPLFAIGLMIGYEIVVDRLLFEPLRRRLEKIIADQISSRAEKFDENNCIEISLRGLPHGTRTRFVMEIGGQVMSVVDRPSLDDFIRFRDTFTLEEAVSVVNEPVKEADRQELASMLEEIPREGMLQIQSEVKDGIRATMRIVRDGYCHEFKCNLVGIPQHHEGAIQVRLLRKIVGLSSAWSRGRGVGTCDKHGTIRIFTGGK